MENCRPCTASRTGHSSPDLQGQTAVHRACAPASRWRAIRARVSGCLLLVQIDAQARLLIWIEIAIAHLRAAREDFVDCRVKTWPFLDAKIMTAQIQVEIGRVSTAKRRRDRARRAHAKGIAHGCQLPGRSYAPIWLRCTRIKSIRRALISGTHSWG